LVVECDCAWRVPGFDVEVRGSDVQRHME
jgi:hypothetical protein